MPICRKCKKNFPNLVKIEGRTRNLHNRKYCISCSPFGLHNTRKLDIPKKQKKCTICGTKSQKDFYKNNNTHLCKKCFSKYLMKRWNKRKIEVINYLGGKCKICKIKLSESHPAIFDFHHRDPNKKELEWRKMRLHPIQKIKNEIKKCSLVCANCHRILHTNKELW